MKYRIDKSEKLTFNSFIIMSIWLISSVTVYYLGIWVSEFSAVTILIPIYYIIYDKNTVKFLRINSRNIWLYVNVIIIITFLIGYYLLRAEIKRHYWDQGYDSYFVTNFNDVIRNFMFFTIKFKTSLLFQDVYAVENIFNLHIILLTILIIFIRIKKKKILIEKDLNIINATLLICIVSILVMFFSYWNLLSEFCPRYYTPVYLAYCFILLFLLDKYLQKKYLKILVLIVFTYTSLGHTYNTIIRHHEKGPFHRYGEFRHLPQGTLIASYWETHKINSVAIDNLQSLPYDYELVRMTNWKEELLKGNTFYFINGPNEIELSDTIRQYGITFKYSGKSYKCNNYDVKLYHKIFQ